MQGTDLFIERHNAALTQLPSLLNLSLVYSEGTRQLGRDNNITDMGSLSEEILECLPLGIIVTDSQNTVVSSNSTAREMLGRMLRKGDKCDLPATGEFGCNQRQLRITQKPLRCNGQRRNLITLTDVTELALEITRLKHQCMTDELTELYNRRGFMNVSQHFIDCARREGRKLLLIFADLDGLKKINDTFGHAQGDLAIKDVADVLKTSMRNSDVLARVGGDEFVILTTVAQGEQADSVVARLKSNIASFNDDRLRPYLLAVSFGTSEVDPESDIELMQLLARADHRMYEYKRKQRLAS